MTWVESSRVYLNLNPHQVTKKQSISTFAQLYNIYLLRVIYSLTEQTTICQICRTIYSINVKNHSYFCLFIFIKSIITIQYNMLTI